MVMFVALIVELNNKLLFQLHMSIGLQANLYF